MDLKQGCQNLVSNQVLNSARAQIREGSLALGGPAVPGRVSVTGVDQLGAGGSEGYVVCNETWKRQIYTYMIKA